MLGAQQTLLNICELIVDCEHKTAPTQETGYPSIRTPNIGRGRLILDGVNRVSEKIYREWSKRAIPQAEDLILAREAPVGNVAIIPENLKVCLGQRTVLIRPDKDKVCPMFLVYFMLGDAIQSRLLGHSTGATVNHLNMKDIRNLELPKLPPLSTQRKIAAVLSAYDDLIENNTRRIQILEEIAQTIYREWFVEFRFPGHEGVPMVKSELGLIPQGWAVGKLGDLCSVVPGYAFKSKDWQDTGVGVVKIKNIKSDNTIDTQNIDCVPSEILLLKLDKYRLVNGDFLIAMTGATAGKVGRLRTKATMMLNQRVAKLDPNDAYRDYVWCKISMEETQKAFFRLADGAAQPNMSGCQIENYKIIRPSLSVCNRFSSVVGEMLIQTDNLILCNANLRQTRDLLLPKLISGELDVSELDIDTD